MDKQFLAEFEHPSFGQWLEKITADLKGKSLEDITHENLEDIRVSPVYGEENSALAISEQALKNQSKTKNNDWIINRDVLVDARSKAANDEALKSLMSGSTSITFIDNTFDFNILLKNIELPYIDLFFRSSSIENFDLDSFLNFLQLREYAKGQVTGAVEINPFGQALKSGALHSSEIDQSIEQAIKIKSELPSMRTVLIDGSVYHNAGASVSQEIGYSLAEGHELLVKLLENGVPIDDASAFFQFEFSSSTQYFFEISKVRVFRALWARIIEEYKPEYSCSTNTFIHSRTSGFTHSTMDMYNNLLRDTSACMAAAIGGADMITVTAFDSAAKDQKKSFGQRLGTNIQLMLKEESGLHQVIDPAAGSYLFNDITNQLAEKAWNIFQSIEMQGGFSKSIAEGTIQKAIQSHAIRLTTAIKNEKLVMVGVNKYVNKEDVPSTAQPPKEVEKNSILPLVPMRLSSEVEASNAQ